MTYTIQQVAQMTNIPATTLRYYDKEGLLPFLSRGKSGYRIFSDLDIASLQITQCLKDTGMPIHEIRQFSQWVQQGDISLKNRHEMFLKRKEIVEKQITDLQKALAIIEYKCDYYKNAVAAGTEKHLLGKDKLPYADTFTQNHHTAASKKDSD